MQLQSCNSSFSVSICNIKHLCHLLTIDPIQQTALQQMKKPHYDTVLLFQIKLAFSLTVDAK